MRSVIRFLPFVCLLFCVPIHAGEPEPVVVDVDCDAGDDLASIFREAQARALGVVECIAVPPGADGDDDSSSNRPFPPPGLAECVPTGPRPLTVNISGTCVLASPLSPGSVPLEINADNVTLDGGSESVGSGTSATILWERDVGPILVTNATRVLLTNLVLACRSSGSSCMDLVNSDINFLRTSIEGSCRAINARGSTLFMQSVEVHGDCAALSVTDHSNVRAPGRFNVFDGGHGIDVDRFSYVQASGTINSVRLNNNSMAFISGVERVIVLNNSELQLGGQVNDVLVANLSTVQFLGEADRGGLRLVQFSNAFLSGGSIESAECDATSDAICHELENIGTSTCARCPATAP